MARRKINERFTRKLTKAGGGRSISITLPIELILNIGGVGKKL